MDVITLARLLPELPVARTRLLDNLGRIRREVGPITLELSDALADHMNIRRGEVHEVVSFYSFLQVPVDTPRVCTGPICDCYGARDLLASTPGAIEVACLGHCDLAPVMTRGDEIVPAVTHSTNEGPAIGLGQRDATLADYAARGGLELVRNPPPPEHIVEELKASGLTGYGGAGFPTGIKWEAVSREPGPRFVVVNADEGEPGTIKDRFVMELRPHLFLEGVLIAMTFAEATDGLIYLREEYAAARNRLLQGIDELRAAGLLEGRSLGLVIGAGAYIAGEETAMLESMEGRRAMPRLRPPFPAQVGYLGHPTLINNVETLAHLPAILRNGGEWWAGLGTRGAAGTRLWSVTGAVGKPGCYEAPNGVTTRELVEEHAGGFAEEVGAIVPGGAASGILPPVGDRHAAHPRRAPRVRRRRRVGRRPGLPRPLLPAPPPRRDDALLRRGVVPEVHALPDREPRPPPPLRGARAWARPDDAREGRRVARSQWRRPRSAVSGRPRRFPVRNAMRWWPELFAPLDRTAVQ